MLSSVQLSIASDAMQAITASSGWASASALSYDDLAALYTHLQDDSATKADWVNFVQEGRAYADVGQWSTYDLEQRIAQVDSKAAGYSSATQKALAKTDPVSGLVYDQDQLTTGGVPLSYALDPAHQLFLPRSIEDVIENVKEGANAMGVAVSNGFKSAGNAIQAHALAPLSDWWGTLKTWLKVILGVVIAVAVAYVFVVVRGLFRKAA